MLFFKVWVSLVKILLLGLVGNEIDFYNLQPNIWKIVDPDIRKILIGKRKILPGKELLDR